MARAGFSQRTITILRRSGSTQVNELPAPIAKQFEADFFFAHPYSSWERGANENMNGLIRQFFLKKMRFDSITVA